MTRADSRRVPPEQIEAVVKELYAAADRLDWEHLAPARRTAQYDKWVTEPPIGGVLAQYMSSENARSWIKDGPMKEYSRARLGAGRYAQFGPANGPTAEQIVSHALGATTSLVSKSVGIKPFHCLATTNGDTTYLAWGDARNIRHLVWACISYLAERPADRAVIVVLETLDHPTTSAEKARHSRIGKQCSIEIKYFRSGVTRRSTDRAVDHGP
jgi:hypothetical protein